jgi:hypothetical protein
MQQSSNNHGLAGWLAVASLASYSLHKHNGREQELWLRGRLGSE